MQLAWQIIAEEEDASWSRYDEMSALWDSKDTNEYLRRRLTSLLKELPDGKRREQVQRLLSELDAE